MTQDTPNFTARLSAALKRNSLQENGKPQRQEDTDMSGLRIGMEFVSGTVVGLAIGYGLDRWFGTLPLFLLIFLVLGFAAGMLNIYRAINDIPEGIGINRQREKRNGLTEDDKTPKSSVPIDTDLPKDTP